MTNAVTEAYNRQCRQPGSKLRYLGEQLQRWPSIADITIPFLPRPLFVADREMRDFAADLMELLDLLAALPERLFDGDVDRFLAALGITGRQAAWSRRLGGGAAPPHFGRCDMNHDGTGFKLLEFGNGSESAGWDRAGEAPKAMLEVDEFAAFAAEHGLGYVDSGRVMADVLRGIGAAAAPGRDPVYVIVEGIGGLEHFGEFWRVTARMLQGYGLDVHVAELGDLSERGGTIHLGSLPVDVVYRCFEVDQVCDDDSAALLEPVCRAHDEGSLVVWSTMANNIYGDKGCLALLSGESWRDVYTPAERELIDRVLPWTRWVTAASLRDEEFVTHCRTHREQLFLKPTGRYGGIGAVPGWRVSDQEWWRALRDGAEQGSIVQQAVPPAVEAVVDPVTGRTEPWNAVWSAFYTPQGYAGSLARLLPAAGDAVISASHGGSVAAVFTYDQPAAAPATTSETPVTEQPAPSAPSRRSQQ